MPRVVPWLGFATPLGVVGVILLIASDSAGDPLFFIGLTCTGIALYVLTALFLIPLPLPGGERRAKAFEAKLDAFIASGYELQARSVNSDEDLNKLTADFAAWASECYDWLVAEVSDTKAIQFKYTSGVAADALGSYDPEHGRLRIAIMWRLAVLVQVKREATSAS
jgi:hypothetical protein